MGSNPARETPRCGVHPAGGDATPNPQQTPTPPQQPPLQDAAVGEAGASGNAALWGACTWPEMASTMTPIAGPAALSSARDAFGAPCA